VAISSADSSEALPKTRQQGFSGYIAKPVDQALLPDQLLAVMEGGSVWHEG
jgi:DNA-binding NarL/FixJ family response regulator